MEIVHKPVLPDEVLEFLAPQRGGQFIDGTLGQGGHAELILLAAPTTEVLGHRPGCRGDRDDQSPAESFR
jgi:16S rRNA C1402 N4-methylase RsmH